MSQIYKLFHFSDSAFPVGSFAYSYGLESTRNVGLLNNSSDLKNHIYSLLQQASSMEIPFINSCYELNVPLDDDKINQIVRSYNAMLLVPSIHKSSISLGKAWLRLLENFYANTQLKKIRERFNSSNLPTHYVIILPIALKTIEFELNDIRALFLHSVLRDQISSAIRLGIIGTMEGNFIQHEFYNFFEELIQAESHSNYSDAKRSTFLLDLNQANHKHVYSKLFQN